MVGDPGRIANIVDFIGFFVGTFAPVPRLIPHRGQRPWACSPPVPPGLFPPIRRLARPAQTKGLRPIRAQRIKGAAGHARQKGNGARHAIWRGIFPAMPETVTLEFLARQLGQVLTDVGAMRDDVRVMSAILMRHDVSFEKSDATMTALLREVRAVHSQIGRMNDRIRKLEVQQP
jgi:hypothetical protein